MVKANQVRASYRKWQSDVGTLHQHGCRSTYNVLDRACYNELLFRGNLPSLFSEISAEASSLASFVERLLAEGPLHMKSFNRFNHSIKHSVSFGCKQRLKPLYNMFKSQILPFQSGLLRV